MKKYKINEQDLNCKKSVNLILEEIANTDNGPDSPLFHTSKVIKKKKKITKDQAFKNIATLNGKIKGWY